MGNNCVEVCDPTIHNEQKQYQIPHRSRLNRESLPTFQKNPSKSSINNSQVGNVLSTS
jgi:hypothetical protein